MLKIRIIPTLLWKNFGLVKGEAFQSWRRIGTVLPAIKLYNKRDVDELFLLNIEGNTAGTQLDYNLIEEFSKSCFVPFSVGGGINGLEEIRMLLSAGADKVTINTIMYENPDLIDKAAKKYGSQCLVASVDAKLIGGTYCLFSHSGKILRKKKLESFVKEIETRGVGEILITSIDRDGTMKGYDIELINKVTKNANIPVVASGGAGSFNDMFKAIHEGGASAVAAASIFHFTQKTPNEAKEFLHSKGIPVRLPLDE